MVLEMLYVDHNGSGEFNLIFGKGFEEEKLEELNPGPIFLVGPCAIEELEGKLRKKYPRKKIYKVNSHNDLAGVSKILMKLMGVKVFQVAPLRANLLWALVKARLHKTTARTPL